MQTIAPSIPFPVFNPLYPQGIATLGHFRAFFGRFLNPIELPPWLPVQLISTCGINRTPPKPLYEHHVQINTLTIWLPIRLSSEINKIVNFLRATHFASDSRYRIRETLIRGVFTGYICEVALTLRQHKNDIW